MASAIAIATTELSEFTGAKIKELFEMRPWMEGKKFTLLYKTTEIEEYISHCIEKGLCALDLETTGLSTRIDKNGESVAKLVGVCLATNADEGVYIPVGHEDKEYNVPLKFILRELARLVANCRCIYHNYKFDGQVLRNYGIIAEDYEMYEDTMMMSAIEDASRKDKKLKHLVETLLGREMIEISQLGVQSGKKDVVAFQMVPPQKAVYYGASDGMCTFALYEYFKAKIDAQDPTGKGGPWNIYNIEKRCLFVTMEMERNLCLIDKKYLEACREDVLARMKKLMAEIYAVAGREFDINSPKQLGVLLFEEMKIPYPIKEKTKSGQYATGEKILELLGDKYPIINMILTYRGHEKVIGTYIENFINNADENDEVKFALNQVRADTGRFSASGGFGLEKDGYSGVNCQNIPNPNEDNPDSIDLRRAVLAHPGYKILSVDYSGEELRVAANYSREPKWIEEFTIGSADLHTKTAQAVTGKDKVSKQERKNAKCVAKGTLVACERGWMPIEHVVVGDRVITHTGALKKVTSVHFMGVKDAHTIETSTGHKITCGVNHKFLTVDNVWVRSEELTPGTVLKTVSCENIDPKEFVKLHFNFWDKGHNNTVSDKLPYVEINPQWARLLGYLLGDGHIHPNYAGLVCSPDYNDVKEDVLKIAGELGLPANAVLRHRVGAKNPIWTINVGSTIFSRFCEHLGFRGRRGKIFRIPDIIFRSPKNVSREFLRGLFETDGTIEKAGVSVCTKDKDLARDVVLLLASFGIKAYIYSKASKKYNRDYYVVQMTRIGCDIFEKEIGFISSKKIQRLKDANSRPRRPTVSGTQLWQATVKVNYKVEPTELWDLTVEDDHTYVAQGLVTHNTLNFHILYGGGAGGFAARAKIPYETSKKMISNYFKEFSQLKRWIDKEIKVSRQRKYSVTVLGRRRPLNEFYDSPDPKVQAKGDRCAVNGAIQGAAADIMKIALYKVWKWIHTNGLENDVRMLAPVHDEIFFEIKEEKLDALVPEICEIMRLRDLVTRLKWPVPLDVDAEYGDSWHVDHDFWKERKNAGKEIPATGSAEPAPAPVSVEPAPKTPVVESPVVSENPSTPVEPEKSIAEVPMSVVGDNKPQASTTNNATQYYINVTVKSAYANGTESEQDLKNVLKKTNEIKEIVPGIQDAHIKDRIDSMGYFNYPVEMDSISARKLKFILETLISAGDTLFIGPRHKVCIVNKSGEVYCRTSEVVSIDAFIALCLTHGI